MKKQSNKAGIDFGIDLSLIKDLSDAFAMVNASNGTNDTNGTNGTEVNTTNPADDCPSGDETCCACTPKKLEERKKRRSGKGWRNLTYDRNVSAAAVAKKKDDGKDACSTWDAKNECEYEDASFGMRLWLDLMYLSPSGSKFGRKMFFMFLMCCCCCCYVGCYV